MLKTYNDLYNPLIFGAVHTIIETFMFQLNMFLKGQKSEDIVCFE